VTPDDDKKIVEILKYRDALLTKLELRDGKVISVWNIAWGYDLGDDFAHITTNISPDQPGYEIDFFYTNNVAKIIDGDDGEIIAEFA